jgi:hypothetical protein
MPHDNRVAPAINIFSRITVIAVQDPLEHAKFFNTTKMNYYVATNGTVHSKVRVAM